MNICKKNGFTLIEILVTIGIVAILMTMSIPVFRNYKYKNDLARGADLVQSAIYETKNLALSPQTEKDDSTGYYVTIFDPNTQGNSVGIYEAQDEDTTFNDMILVKKFDLPSGVTIEESADFPTEGIFFSIEKQGKITKPTQNSEILIKHNNIDDGNNSKTVIVNHVTGQAIIE